MENLTELAKAIKEKNIADTEVARIVNRPALMGHVGEYIASNIFDIRLEHSATSKAIDGHFNSGSLLGKTVNIKWYAKMERMLDISKGTSPDFYLVMTGPIASAASSRGGTRPWLINYVFLFNSAELKAKLKIRNIGVGVATSVIKQLWNEAEVYPAQCNHYLVLSSEQKRLIGLFA
ncbi:hypothetical protein ACFLXL_02440 [Chloroflexota bacterium]